MGIKIIEQEVTDLSYIAFWREPTYRAARFDNTIMSRQKNLLTHCSVRFVQRMYLMDNLPSIDNARF